MNTIVAKMISSRFQFSLLAGTCFICSVLFLAGRLEAAPAVTASYSQSSGTRLVIEITTGSPPPASVILVQRFPAGTTMVSSQPGASNYNAGKNVAKWLLRNLRPGKSMVTVTLDRAVSAGEVSAEIRFKPQDGGGMETVQVGR